jgi:hypothetical protein
MKTLSLLIPGLLGPLPELNDADIALPECEVLNTWLARAEKKTTSSTTYYKELAELFNVQAGYSIAHASARYDQCNCEEAFWYRADPVHFKADMDHALLFDCQRLNIIQDEALSLVESFNQHFLEDGLKLVVAHKDRWYLQSKIRLDIETTCLGDAIGRNVSHFLPTGKDALNWRKFLNEAQMLFHSHQVNESRESKGELTINSLWLWGEGESLTPSTHNFNWMMSEEPVANGLVMNSICDLMPMIKSVDDIQDLESDGLIIIDGLFNVVNAGDVSSWSEGVMQICQQWLQPLDLLLKKRKIEQINLYTSNGSQFVINANKLLKIWRRPKSIKASMNLNEHV